MTERPAVVVLVPLLPSATGNGLAMRMDLLVQAASVHHDVHVVVVPVAGRPPVVRPTVVPASQVVLPRQEGTTRDGLTRLLADPVQRAALEAMDPIPPMVRSVSPAAVVDAVRAQVGARGAVGVVAGRLWLAQSALAVARDLGVPFVLDVDDDDEGFQRAAGNDEAADGWGRVAAGILPHAAGVLAAAQSEADVLAARHGRAVSVMPNAVHIPAELAGPPPGHGRVLLVANLTYRPNTEGAAWLVREVLPRLPADCTIDLVGPAPSATGDLAGPRVTVHGPVDDLAPHYAAADVVTVPVHRAAGTRLKVLEAMAVGRPVVSTRAGVAGLDVEPDVHVLVADDPQGFADALAQARDAATSEELIRSARDLVARTYDADVVARTTGAWLRDAFST